MLHSQLTRLASSKRVVVAIYLVCIALLALIFPYFGIIGWPGLHWDASLFGTPVINVASGRGWHFGSFTGYLLSRPSSSYDFHGLLHVILYGLILKCSTWNGYLLAQSWINAITFVVYSLLYSYILVKRNSFKTKYLFLSIPLASIAGLIAIGLQGRPEQLAPLILGITLAGSLNANKVKLILINGIGIGTLILLSPLLGFLFGLVFSFYLYSAKETSRLKRACMAIAAICIGFITTYVLIELFTPFSAISWYKNIFGVGTAGVDAEGFLFKIRLYKFGYTLIAPIWNILFIWMIIAAGAWLWRAKHSFLSLVILTIILFTFTLRMLDYGYTPFIPYGIGLCLIYLGNYLEEGSPRNSKSLSFLQFAVSASYSAIIMSYVLACIYIPHNQLSLSEAKKKFDSSLAGKSLFENTSAVGFSALMWPSMVVLGNADSRFIALHASTSVSSNTDEWLDKYEAKEGRLVKYFIHPQSGTSLNTSPPPIIYVGSAKFILLESNWVKPGFLDKLLQPKGITNRYNYALYSRYMPDQT